MRICNGWSREARSRVESSLVVAYVGRAPTGPLGTAYFDTHRVRTEAETILVTVRPDGSVGGVEVVAFGEPEDYLPRPAWLRLFFGRKLDPDLVVGRGLAYVSGASLVRYNTSCWGSRPIGSWYSTTAGSKRKAHIES